MTTDVILGWHDFFMTIAQVGATLAGLLFVGLTISLPHVLGVRGYLSCAFAALFLQFEMLVIGLSGLVPGQPAWLLGAGVARPALRESRPQYRRNASSGPGRGRNYRRLAECALSACAGCNRLPLSLDRQCLGVLSRDSAPQAARLRLVSA